MRKLKNVLLQLTFGVIVGNLVADLAAPGVLAWYNIPGSGQALCNCADLVHTTVHSLLRAQLVGSVIGATVFLSLGTLIGKKPKGVDPGLPIS